MKLIAVLILVAFLSRCSARNNVQQSEEAFGGRYRRQLHVKPTMQSLRISSVITSRFSDVVMVSKVINKESVAQKVIYEAQLPKTAFISNFSMIIDGNTYVGVVKETEVAITEFSQSVERGETVGLIKTSGRETQWFEISVNIAAFSEVTFNLRYQELLTRKLGQYEHVIFADIEKGIEAFELDVYITEPTGIKSIHANKPYKASTINAEKDENFQVEVRKSSVQAQVSYRINPRHFEREGSHNRRFVVNYDAERGPGNGGDLQVYDNCFAHFFAPQLPSMRKRIIFAIDVSGSMIGEKMEQTKSAFKSILSEVRDFDEFGIVTFSGRIRTWKASLQLMSKDGIKNLAQEFVENLHARGSTNLFGALDKALGMLNSRDREVDELGEESVTDMIILLTDGNPTAGIIPTDTIVTKTVTKNKNNIQIYCLGFGTDVDHRFLKKLAEENHGIARRIYIDSDSELQLKGFYNEVSSPLLSGITVSVPETLTKKVTGNEFDKYFRGSELVVMGKMRNEFDGDLNVVVSGMGQEGPFEESVSRNMIEREFSFPVAEGMEDRMEMFCERMWAYLTIKQLFKRKEIENDRLFAQSRKEEYDRRILRLALKFNFVTPLTSMIARKPNNMTETARVQEKDATRPRPQTRLMHHGTSMSFRAASSRLALPRPVIQSMRRNKGRFSPPAPSMTALSGQAIRGMANKAVSRIASPRWSFLSRYVNILSVIPTTTTTTTTATTTTTTTTTPPPPTTTTPTPVSYPRIQELSIDPTCGTELELGVSENRTISSPLYPHMYPGSTTCKWVIISQVPFSLEYQSFDLEVDQNGYCLHDRVMMYSDSKEKPKVICGGKMQRNRFEVKRKMTIIFQSDNAVQGMGFQAIASPNLSA